MDGRERKGLSNFIEDANCKIDNLVLQTNRRMDWMKWGVWICVAVSSSALLFALAVFINLG